jgi:hypothetical protein
MNADGRRLQATFRVIRAGPRPKIAATEKPCMIQTFN